MEHGKSPLGAARAFFCLCPWEPAGAVRRSRWYPGISRGAGSPQTACRTPGRVLSWLCSPSLRARSKAPAPGGRRLLGWTAMRLGRRQPPETPQIYAVKIKSQKQRTATIYIWFICAKVGKHRQNRKVDMIVLTFLKISPKIRYLPLFYTICNSVLKRLFCDFLKIKSPKYAFCNYFPAVLIRR